MIKENESIDSSSFNSFQSCCIYQNQQTLNQWNGSQADKSIPGAEWARLSCPVVPSPGTAELPLTARVRNFLILTSQLRKNSHWNLRPICQFSRWRTCQYHRDLLKISRCRVILAFCPPLTWAHRSSKQGSWKQGNFIRFRLCCLNMWLSRQGSNLNVLYKNTSCLFFVGQHIYTGISSKISMVFHFTFFVPNTFSLMIFFNGLISSSCIILHKWLKRIGRM